MGTSMGIRATAPQIFEQVQEDGKKKKCGNASHIFGNRHDCVRNADAMRDKRRRYDPSWGSVVLWTYLGWEIAFLQKDGNLFEKTNFNDVKELDYPSFEGLFD